MSTSRARTLVRNLSFVQGEFFVWNIAGTNRSQSLNETCRNKENCWILVIYKTFSQTITPCKSTLNDGLILWMSFWKCYQNRKVNFCTRFSSIEKLTIEASQKSRPLINSVSCEMLNTKIHWRRNFISAIRLGAIGSSVVGSWWLCIASMLSASEIHTRD